ncbi:hypothetical protein [Speluncibacter jeojiensis]|uniref:Uncharacterized protein n=1 Tax=Speluncibacter jeojiensis TaxID=2710754 RepID=A0A9X4RGB4_9ACTN|nr:hypothetical protein [Corynebacteriales bacterium D3-21]
MSTPTAPTVCEFTTADMDEAREFLDSVYGWRLTVHRHGNAGRPLVVSRTDAGAVSCAHATAPGDISYQVAGEDFVVIDTLSSGVFELEHDKSCDRYGPGDVYVANHPGAEFRSTTRDIEVLTTTLPSTLFAEVAGAAPDTLVEFSSYTPIAGAGRRW